MGSEICRQDRLVRHMKTDEWVSLGTQDTSQGERGGGNHMVSATGGRGPNNLRFAPHAEMSAE
jgi:hypothetical protein